MCSIMGYCGGELSIDAFKEGFDRTISRGPDETRIVRLEHVVLGFHRLAIMGLQPEAMQPFSLDGDYLICNGEISRLSPDKRIPGGKGLCVPERIRL